MRINTLFYSIRQGFRNIGRNKMFSLASIATMSACIFMFGLFYIIITNFTNMVRVAEESVAVTVFFDEGTSDERMEEIGQEIVKRAEVSKCVFVSAEEAWEDVKQNYFEGREDLAAAFQGDNPVANSAHYEIYLSDVSMQEVLVDYLENMDDVRSVKQSEMVANTLSDFNRLIGYVSAGIILILLCVAVFLISNTVSVGISVRREEIAIMKLIGATDFLVRAPFVVEGMVIGLVGAFIPLALLYFLYGKIILYITDKFNFIGSILDFVAAEELFRTLVPIAVILGIGIGFAGSFATVRKHLKI
jgi:cell division transport system permease protein